MSLIFEKIPKILARVEAIGKDRKNLQQGYNFRGIDDMYNDLHKHFAEEGVFITSKILSSSREERPTKSGGVMIYSIIDFEFTFYATDGSFVTTQQRGEASDSGDKSSNKSASTALKYALMQTLLIPTIEDKDTENASPEFTPKATQPTTPDLPWLNQYSDKEKTKESDLWRRTVLAVTSGVPDKNTGELRVLSIDDLRKHYKISKEIQASLESVINNYKP